MTSNAHWIGCEQKRSIIIDESGSKIARNSVLDCKTSDTWESKTLFLTTFDLCSSIVLTFLIAAYPMCYASCVNAQSGNLVYPQLSYH